MNQYMKKHVDRGSSPPNGLAPHGRWLLSLVGAVALFILLKLLHPGHHDAPVSASSSEEQTKAVVSRESARVERAGRLPRQSPAAPAPTAEEVVAQKVGAFGKSRRAIAHRIADRLGKETPPEIEMFFDAIESGNWDEIQSRWKELATHTHQYEYSKSDRPDLEPYWGTVLDAYGVAEQAHDWPAQKLLDYGNAILDSLRPGMVYVGGTDNGRWVPELLNETGSDPHIIVTQNAFADGTYQEYMRELYGDRFSTLSQEDSQRAFAEYLTDAKKRLEHDQQFPDEPKQLRPGESVTMKDGTLQVSGMVAVMSINEKLLQMLMQKNPDLSFAIQESMPLRGTYSDALPLGPLMELGAKDAQTSFTAERAGQAVDYWQTAAQQLLADPQAAGSETALKSYSHDVNSTANLLASHGFNSEAEQAYRLSSQLWPANPEAIGGLAAILSQTGRADEAHQLLDNFAREHPDQRAAAEKASATFLWTAPTTKQ
jgi:tetratricopeptide (TPR) repeat protein